MRGTPRADSLLHPRPPVRSPHSAALLSSWFTARCYACVSALLLLASIRLLCQTQTMPLAAAAAWTSLHFPQASTAASTATTAARHCNAAVVVAHDAQCSRECRRWRKSFVGDGLAGRPIVPEDIDARVACRNQDRGMSFCRQIEHGGHQHRGGNAGLPLCCLCRRWQWRTAQDVAASQRCVQSCVGSCRGRAAFETAAIGCLSHCAVLSRAAVWLEG